jgi:serine/threonine-protein kinase
MLKAGERIGDWIIEGPLGEGGMGAVYRVHSALTQRLAAALKVMKPTEEPDARARFVREAEALSALRHPAVVRVMGFSEDPQRGLLYLVMELALGETLRQRVARGAMELPEALATFVPLAQGLDHAHASGIFHRDLKPANVVLTVDGTPRLVDFGIAAALHAEPLTSTGQLGTLPYLPPEVFRGQQADPAAIDVYAFGLLLHEALTGQRAFAVDAASTPAAAAAAIGVRKLQVPRVELPQHFPERVRDLVRQATDADPSARPTMRELRIGLESAVERRSAGDLAERYVPVVPAPAVTEDKTTRVPDPTDVPLAGSLAEAVGITGGRGLGRRRGDRTRHRLLVATIGAVFFVLGVVLFARRGDEPAAAGSSPAPSPAVTRREPARRSASPATSAVRPSAAPASPARLEASPPAPLGDAAEAAAAAPEPQAAPADEPPAPEAGGERLPSGPPRAPPAGAPAGDAPEAGPEPRGPSAAEPVQVGGRWEVTHHVEATSYEPFQDMLLGYELTLVQDGSRVYGQGRKVSENGVLLPRGQRTPIEVAGRIENGQVILNFTETGGSRTSRGTIRWRLAQGDDLQGNFASDAANSRGASSGRRLR